MAMGEEFKKALKDFAESGMEVFEKVHNDILELKLTEVLDDPSIIGPFLDEHLSLLCGFFNCASKPQDLISNWKLNIERGYTITSSGVDIADSLKEVLTQFFKKFNDELVDVTKATVQKSVSSGWDNLKELEEGDIHKLIKDTVVISDDEDKTIIFLQASCKVFEQLGFAAFEDLGFTLYRNLKSTMRGEGVSGMKDYVENLKLKDGSCDEMWAKLKPKILELMEYDSALD